MEGTRGWWLFKLLKRTGHVEDSREPILAKLKNATPETVPYWDCCQLMVLAHVYADEGSKEAYQIIYEKFAEQLYDPDIGGPQIMMLDGLSGFLHVAEVVGARLKREVDFLDDGWLLYSADDEFGEEGGTEALRERSQTNSNVAAFGQAAQQTRPPMTSSWPGRSGSSAAPVHALAATRQRHPSRHQHRPAARSGRGDQWVG
jgi:hypothetical protein